MCWAPFVAWDAEIAEDDLQWPGFANLPAKEQDRFLRARSQHLTGDTINHFDALWHFYALHVERKASSLDASGQKRQTLVWPRQSGIDARITTDLFKHALDGVDHIILVTRDADYADPLHAIKAHFKNIQIDVLTMNVRPPKEFDGIAQRLWKGKWNGQNMTVECVPPSPKN
nr:NYN domain-containing protein [Gluconobacter sp. Dm-74]